MCGRYSIGHSPDAVGKHFDVSVPFGMSAPRYNAGPGSILPLIRVGSELEMVLGRWGFFFQRKTNANAKSLVINARRETLKNKKMFSPLLGSRRCLIPADGFFEWQRTGGQKQPWRFALKDEGLFAFAGLYEMAETEKGVLEFSFVIVTTSANELVGEIHDRMPVIFDKTRQSQWLKQPIELVEDLLEPFSGGKMKSYKVTPAVGSTRYSQPDAILPWQDRNPTLF